MFAVSESSQSISVFSRSLYHIKTTSYIPPRRLGDPQDVRQRFYFITTTVTQVEQHYSIKILSCVNTGFFQAFKLHRPSKSVTAQEMKADRKIRGIVPLILNVDTRWI